jgi:OOP family OmpA-OmpF porin
VQSQKKRRSGICIRVVSLAAFVASGARSEDITYTADYFSVLPGLALPSKKLGTVGTGATLSGIYGRELDTFFSLEANVQYSTFETGANAGTDYYQPGLTIGATYTPFDRRASRLFTPFVLLGLGGVYDDFFPVNRHGVAFLAEAGTGFVTRPFFADRIRFRFDARYTHDGKEGGHPEGRIMAGIEIPLGSIAHRVDYLPGKTEIREVVREVERPAPGPPSTDSDGDGVDDVHDQCPNTPRGLKVDSVGCAIGSQTLALHGVTFDTNKARLTLNAQAVLDQVARAFSGQPTLKVEIAGHTDSVGSVAANQKLSQLRADAVRAYLMSAGVRPDQLQARGYGKSELLVSPETGESDRERNRRVELRVLAQ